MGYPTAPAGFTPEQQEAWNILKKQLEARDVEPTQLGRGFVVSGTVATCVTIDLGAPEVTATTMAVAMLLKALRLGGLIQVILR